MDKFRCVYLRELTTCLERPNGIERLIFSFNSALPLVFLCPFSKSIYFFNFLRHKKRPYLSRFHAKLVKTVLSFASKSFSLCSGNRLITKSSYIGYDCGRYTCT